MAAIDFARWRLNWVATLYHSALAFPVRNLSELDEMLGRVVAWLEAHRD